jgi:hypothetical protein
MTAEHSFEIGCEWFTVTGASCVGTQAGVPCIE